MCFTTQTTLQREEGGRGEGEPETLVRVEFSGDRQNL